jgi:hypothetical protein
LRCIGDSGWRQGLQHGLYALKPQELGVVWCIVLTIELDKNAHVTGNRIRALITTIDDHINE